MARRDFYYARSMAFELSAEIHSVEQRIDALLDQLRLLRVREEELFGNRAGHSVSEPTGNFLRVDGARVVVVRSQSVQTDVADVEM